MEARERQPLIAILLPDLRGGGVERMRLYLARRFIELGCRVDFVLMEARGELLEQVPQGARVIDCQAPRIRHVVKPLSSYLRATRPDVLLAALWPLTVIAVLAHRIAGAPGRIVVSDHIALKMSSVANAWHRRLILSGSMAVAYRLAQGRIAVSKGVADDVALFGRLDRKSIDVIYNPAACMTPNVEESSVDPWQNYSGKRILSVGNLKEQKDHELLIRSFSIIRKETKAKLVILGEGSHRAHLESVIESLGLSNDVELPGFVSSTGPWYAKADLFVLSSRYEGFGNVIVEALQHGLPVVSTDCRSGPAEILDNGRYGRLVPVGEEGALATAMRESLTTVPDRAVLKMRARDYDVESIADRYMNVLLPDKFRRSWPK